MSAHDDTLHASIPSCAFESLPSFSQLFDDDDGSLSGFSSSQLGSSSNQDSNDSSHDAAKSLVALQNNLELTELLPRCGKLRSGFLLTVYTSKTVLQKHLSRTRVCVLKFPDAHNRVEFVGSLLQRIQQSKGGKNQRFGFNVRSATFVPDAPFLWVVIISLSALSFQKWHKVFTRLGAIDMKVAIFHREGGAGSQTSLETAADMLDPLTNIEELAANEITCDVDPELARRAAGHVKRSSKENPAPSAPPSYAAATIRNPLAAVQLPNGGRAGAQGERPPPHIDGVISLASICCSQDSSVNPDLVNECLAFLTSQHIPSIEQQHKKLLEHLYKIPSAYSQIGLYFLSGHSLELLGRIVHLRTAVVRALWTQYGIDGRVSMSTAWLAKSDGYSHIPRTGQTVLRMISQCIDQVTDLPIYAFVDAGAVVTLASIFVAKQALPDNGVDSEAQFCDSIKLMIFEQIWWLVTMGCRLSSFLSLEMQGGLLLHENEAALLFPDPQNETQNLFDSVQEFPGIQSVLRNHPKSCFSLKARNKYYKGKLASSVSRVQAAYGIPRFGAAFQATQTVLDHSSLFYQLLADSVLYRALPATKFTDDASLHVPGHGDLQALALLCDGRQ